MKFANSALKPHLAPRLLVGFFLGLVLTSCQKASNSSHIDDSNATSSSRPSLQGLSTKQVIATKYDQAQIVCHLQFPLEIANGRGGVESESGSDVYTWDLLNDFSESRTAQMKATSLGINSYVELNFSKIEIENGSFVALDGTTYEFQSSPYVSLGFRFQTDKMSKDGMVLQPGGSADKNFDVLNENVTNILVSENGDVKAQDGKLILHHELHLDCSLQTELKPAYADQFKKH